MYSKSEKIQALGGFIILGIIIIFFIKACKSSSDENSSSVYDTYKSSTSNSSDISDGISDDDKAMCWTLAEKTVKSYLKSPSSAKFPFSYISDGVAFDRDGSTYYVAGWVEAENSFGANIRSGFLVTLEKSGEDFKVVSCSIEGN